MKRYAKMLMKSYSTIYYELSIHIRQRHCAIHELQRGHCRYIRITPQGCYITPLPSVTPLPAGDGVVLRYAIADTILLAAVTLAAD